MGKVDMTKYIIVNPDLNSKDFKMGYTSPTYGKYIMTKIVTVDYISACEDKVLGPVNDCYQKISNALGSTTRKRIESKNFNGTELSKFELYTPLLEDNMKLPVALPINFIMKLLLRLI